MRLHNSFTNCLDPKDLFSVESPRATEAASITREMSPSTSVGLSADEEARSRGSRARDNEKRGNKSQMSSQAHSRTILAVTLSVKDSIKRDQSESSKRTQRQLTYYLQLTHLTSVCQSFYLSAEVKKCFKKSSKRTK